jgi:biotin operon repressor
VILQRGGELAGQREVRWRRRSVENDEYASFIRRILRACSRRVGDGDAEALALMLGLAEEIVTAIAEAVNGLRACGYSWAEIGARLGITRQAAQQRWGTLRQSVQQARPGDH